VLPFLCRCPNTGDNVQAWAADAQAHLMNPKTGKVLGSDDE
jgi:hypothetical protein